MKFYAIRIGRKNNTIVTTWSECENLVKGYKGAEYESFKDMRDAENYIFGEKEIDIEELLNFALKGLDMSREDLIEAYKLSKED